MKRNIPEENRQQTKFYEKDPKMLRVDKELMEWGRRDEIPKNNATKACVLKENEARVTTAKYVWN